MSDLRRKQERIQYPIDYRPVIEICGIKYKIHDISRGGVNIIVPQMTAFVLHKDIKAQFIIDADHLVDFSGVLSILPPRYTLVFTHTFDYSIEGLADYTCGLEVNGFTFNAIDIRNKNIPLFVNELEINSFSRMLPPVKGMVWFHDGEAEEVEGFVLRVKQRGTAMKFHSFLSQARIDKEKEYVESIRLSPESRYSSQMRFKVPKNPSERGYGWDI